MDARQASLAKVSSNGAPAKTQLIPTLAEILSADPDEFVAKFTDIAAINLACAEGLPGAEAIDPPRLLAALGAMALWCRQKTAHSWHFYDHNPDEFHGSKNVFRIMTMLGHLYKHFGVHYNPARVSRDSEYDPADVKDNFIYGILSEHRMGTCATLPVFAVAVGRRLGYPLKLVNVPDHLLFRWDDGQERFNMDYNGEGYAIHPDDYYKTWPVPWNEDMCRSNEELHRWLTPLTAKQEVATFLGFRYLALESLGRIQEGIASLDAAERFDPAGAGIYRTFRYVTQGRSTGSTIIFPGWTGN